MAQIVIRLRPDGTIEAVTQGLEGTACLPYIETVEALTDARTVASHYTEDYGRREHVPTPAAQDGIDVGGA